MFAHNMITIIDSISQHDFYFFKLGGGGQLNGHENLHVNNEKHMHMSCKILI